MGIYQSSIMHRIIIRDLSGKDVSFIQRINLMYKHYLAQPLWFKILTLSAFLISILFSSLNNDYYQSGSKLAAALFFGAYGYNMWNNKKVCAIFFGLMVLCIYLAWSSLKLARL